MSVLFKCGPYRAPPRNKGDSGTTHSSPSSTGRRLGFSGVRRECGEIRACSGHTTRPWGRQGTWSRLDPGLKRQGRRSRAWALHPRPSGRRNLRVKAVHVSPTPSSGYSHTHRFGRPKDLALRGPSLSSPPTPSA